MWAQQSLMGFIMFQIDRANRGEIAKSTIKNYYKATMLFCETNDLTHNGKKLTSTFYENSQLTIKDRFTMIKK
jgi:hypothetical protein